MPELPVWVLWDLNVRSLCAASELHWAALERDTGRVVDMDLYKLGDRAAEMRKQYLSGFRAGLQFVNNQN